MSGVPIPLPPGAPAHAAAVVKLERDRHVAFAFAAADLLIEVDLKGDIMIASGAAKSIVGRGIKTLVGSPVEMLAYPADRSVIRNLLKKIVQTGRIDPAAIRLCLPDGKPVHILLGGCRLPNMPQSVFLSVTVLPGALATAADDQPRDETTGLLTKDALMQAARQAVGGGSGGTAQLKLVHLDGLTGAASQLGPVRAAALMEEIGGALRAQSVGGDGAGRLGEDSFGVLAKAGEDPARDVALLSDLGVLIRQAGVRDGVVASRVSKLDLSTDGLSEEESGRALAYAMNSFIAAKGGAFTIASLQDGLAAAMQATVARFAEVRDLIAGGGLTLVYQPVVLLASRAVHHYEALSRFPDNKSTYETVVFSEDMGLIADLDLAVCHRAVEALERNPAVSIAINMSGRSVQSDRFRQALGEILRPRKDIHKRLIFELTESAAIENMEEAATFLRWLRKLGFAVCLDDFGAGAAAYSYLRRFDVDYVKIDGPFLNAAGESIRDRALIRSICVLASDIGCKVVGEMIEDEKTVVLSRALGVDYGQGYLFGKPSADFLETPVMIGRRKGATESWG